MTRIERSALLPYSAEKLFDLIADIESYPDYMDGCVAAKILKQEGNIVEAQLDLKKGGVSQRFSTRNYLQRPQKITMALVEGPFDSLQGEWYFKSLAEEACKVSLDLNFTMNSSLANKAIENLFENIARNLVNSLCRQANKQFGS